MCTFCSVYKYKNSNKKGTRPFNEVVVIQRKRKVVKWERLATQHA